MGIDYRAVQWNRQKRLYDFALSGAVGAFLVMFGVVSKVLFPLVTDEILLLRAFGTGSLVLLHVILCIGPLCRLDRRFLPLLYNRRHAGVVLSLTALIHSVLVVVTYHAGGDVHPLVGIFAGASVTGSVASIPFQPFGFFALLIILLMAATSHDFWLTNLSAPVWKSLHLLVYVAYGLLVLHVTFGILQSERSWVYPAAMGSGLVTVLGLHLLAAFRELKTDASRDKAVDDSGFVDVCAVAEISEKRARIVSLAGERVAIFKYDGKVSALSNLCQHQNGPLGEGKILDGCVTCPWHGYQYLPETGASPPPFVEKVPTFRVRVRNGRVFVDPRPNPPGTRTDPALIEAGCGTGLSGCTGPTQDGASSSQKSPSTP
jgi:nitrite reductase/ring-hydroxylating ferredoxin subunit